MFLDLFIFITYACNGKRFAIAILVFFLILLVVAFFERTDKLFSSFCSIAALDVCDQDWNY